MAGVVSNICLLSISFFRSSGLILETARRLVDSKLPLSISFFRSSGLIPFFKIESITQLDKLSISFFRSSGLILKAVKPKSRVQQLLLSISFFRSSGLILILKVCFSMSFCTLFQSPSSGVQDWFLNASGICLFLPTRLSISFFRSSGLIHRS